MCNSVNIIILGDLCVGKTSFVEQCLNHRFYDTRFTTIGIEYKRKKIVMENCEYLLNVWDSSGDKECSKYIKKYYPTIDGIIFAYDITSYKSFVNVKNWLDDCPSGIPKLLLGCKSDLPKPEVTIQMATVYAKENDMDVFETSSKMNQGVQDAMLQLIFKIITKKYGVPIFTFDDVRNVSRISEKYTDSFLVKDRNSGLITGQPENEEETKETDTDCCCKLWFF